MIKSYPIYFISYCQYYLYCWCNLIPSHSGLSLQLLQTFETIFHIFLVTAWMSIYMFYWRKCLNTKKSMQSFSAVPSLLISNNNGRLSFFILKILDFLVDFLEGRNRRSASSMFVDYFVQVLQEKWVFMWAASHNHSLFCHFACIM